MFSPNKIEALQLALKALDLYEGKIDGLVGPLTLAAVQKFETLMLNPPAIDKPDSGEPAGKPEAVAVITDGQGSDLEQALIFTLKNEGGYSDHPDDHGGATNKGITIKRLSEYLGKPATKDDVKNLSYEMIKRIYQKYYWDVLKLDNVLDQGIATAIFDMGVLCGTGTIVRIAKKILNLDTGTQMDAATLAALNATTDDQFISRLVELTLDRFNTIVENNPSQQVFIKGWNNRAKRLLSLINNDEIEAIIPARAGATKIGEGLHALANGAGVSAADIDRMIAFQNTLNPDSNPRYWVVFQIKKHSKEKRMHIFDRVNHTVQSIHAVHGTGSDEDHNGLATDFSNVPESHKSSLGMYKTLGTYTMAKHGRALRLEGLEESNNNALKRGIVFHGVDYAGDQYVQKFGRCGRSHGCPAVEFTLVQDLIDKIKGGSLFLITPDV